MRREGLEEIDTPFPDQACLPPTSFAASRTRPSRSTGCSGTNPCQLPCRDDLTSRARGPGRRASSPRYASAVRAAAAANESASPGPSSSPEALTRVRRPRPTARSREPHRLAGQTPQFVTSRCPLAVIATLVGNMSPWSSTTLCVPFGATLITAPNGVSAARLLCAISTT